MRHGITIGNFVVISAVTVLAKHQISKIKAF